MTFRSFGFVLPGGTLAALFCAVRGKGIAGKPKPESKIMARLTHPITEEELTFAFLAAPTGSKASGFSRKPWTR